MKYFTKLSAPAPEKVTRAVITRMKSLTNAEKAVSWAPSEASNISKKLNTSKMRKWLDMEDKTVNTLKNIINKEPSLKDVILSAIVKVDDGRTFRSLYKGMAQ